MYTHVLRNNEIYKWVIISIHTCWDMYALDCILWLKVKNTKYSGKKGSQVFYNCKYVILIVDTL